MSSRRSKFNSLSDDEQDVEWSGGKEAPLLDTKAIRGLEIIS